MVFFAASCRRFVMVHGFLMKTKKTPKAELKKTQKLMADFLATDPTS